MKTQLEAADSNPLNQIKVQSDRYPAKLCVLGLSGEILVGKHWSEHIFIRFQILYQKPRVQAQRKPDRTSLRQKEALKLLDKLHTPPNYEGQILLC